MDVKVSVYRTTRVLWEIEVGSRIRMSKLSYIGHIWKSMLAYIRAQFRSWDSKEERATLECHFVPFRTSYIDVYQGSLSCCSLIATCVMPILLSGYLTVNFSVKEFWGYIPTLPRWLSWIVNQLKHVAWPGSSPSCIELQTPPLNSRTLLALSPVTMSLPHPWMSGTWRTFQD